MQCGVRSNEGLERAVSVPVGVQVHGNEFSDHNIVLAGSSYMT
jgi:hypothetical protein